MLIKLNIQNLNDLPIMFDKEKVDKENIRFDKEKNRPRKYNFRQKQRVTNDFRCLLSVKAHAKIIHDVSKERPTSNGYIFVYK